MPARATYLLAVLLLAATGAAILFLGTGGGGGGGRGDEDRAGDEARDEVAPARLPDASIETAPGLAGADVAFGTPTGGIRVRVLDGESRAAVSGLPVHVSRRDSGAGTVATVRTDEMGVAAFDRIRVGTEYVVGCDPPGDRPLERSDVEVCAGETTDLGIWFTRARGVVEGEVVDEEGKPFPEATVSATVEPRTLAASDDHPFASPLVFGRAIASVATDETGAFRLEGLPLGLVAVRADARGMRTTIDRVRLARGVLPVRLLFVLSRGHVLRGEVVDGDGKPVPGVGVEVTLARGGNDLATTVTGASGAFEVAGFRAPDLALEVVLLPPLGPGARYARVHPTGDRVRFVADGGALIDLTVLDRATDRPLPSVDVWHSRGPPVHGETAGPSTTLAASTDDQGRVRFEVRPLTLVDPRVKAAGYRSTGDPRTRWEGDRGRVLSRGETRVVRLWLSRPPHVVGKVTDAAGEPLQGARVQAPGAHAVTTDSRGDYRVVDAVFDTQATILARRAEWTQWQDVLLRGVQPDAAAVRLDIRLDAEPPPPAAAGAVSSSESRPASVRGRVVDENRLPVPGARVEEEWTDAEGRYALKEVPVRKAVPGVPGPPYFVLLSVEADGYLPSTTRAPAYYGQDVNADDIVLGHGWSLRGRVVAPDGSPLPSTRVGLDRTGSGALERWTLADDAGRFVLHALPFRHSPVVAFSGPYVARATLDAASEPPPTLRAWKRVDCRGRVVSEQGAPLAWGTVEIRFDGLPRDAFGGALEILSAAANGLGEFHIATTASNATALRATFPGYEPQEIPLPPDSNPIEIRLRRKSAR